MATDQLDRVFSALADPTRRAILERLTEGDASVGELTAPFDVSQMPMNRTIARVLLRCVLAVVATHDMRVASGFAFSSPA